MLIATRNIIIAPLAIVTIAGIVSSVRGGGFNKDRAPPQLLGLPRCSMGLEISMGLYGARLQLENDSGAGYLRGGPILGAGARALQDARLGAGHRGVDRRRHRYRILGRLHRSPCTHVRPLLSI